jgi:signal transduction histidine kinase
MKILLLLSPSPEFAAGISVVLSSERYRLIPRDQTSETETLLRQGLIDACIVDADLTNVQPCRSLEFIRRLAPQCPILVYTLARPCEWEEEAYLVGATHVLMKPVRAPLLNTLLDRLWPSPSPNDISETSPPRTIETAKTTSVLDSQNTLAVLRNFSGILSNTLCSKTLLRQFLQFLREILGVNRAAIFLRLPVSALSTDGTVSDDRRLRSACAIGLAPGLLDYLTLSLEGGIAGYLFRQGRILTRTSAEAARDHEIQKEFELLGVQVAVPILDRESLIGMAVFDGRLTGEPFANDELFLVFHLLEQLGLAIRNSWLHDELVAGHEMMMDVLSQLNCGCLVINQSLDVIHSNRAARSLFSITAGTSVRFHSLPHPLSTKAYEALAKGQEVPVFLYRPPDHPDRVYRITICPFARANPHASSAVLLVVEDYTSQDRTQKLEIEAANLRLVRSMAEHLAHEIGNSLVPISTHQQLLGQKLDDDESRASLMAAMTVSVNRIARLTQQMVFLAQDVVAGSDSISLDDLLEGAFKEAQGHCPPPPARLAAEKSNGGYHVQGDRKSLSHALAEILINAFQANAINPVASIRVRQDRDAENQLWTHIEVEDSGPGFTEDLIRKVRQPFFSTRTVGLGLGLTVARKIVEAHRGRLILQQAGSKPRGIVLISLPSASGL